MTKAGAVRRACFWPRPRLQCRGCGADDGGDGDECLWQMRGNKKILTWVKEGCEQDPRPSRTLEETGANSNDSTARCPRLN